MDGTTKGRILIVDDEKSNILHLNRILSADYEIHAAKDGQEGIRLANRYLPDLIILDIVMSGMSGYEILSALKDSEKTKSIPVIFITGLSDNAEETKGLALGADDYIVKPFHDDIVKLRVRNQLKLIKQMKTIIAKELAEYKSRTKAAFLSRMSHEMRSPMNVIIGITSLAKMEHNMASIQNHLRTIEKSSRAMLGLIDSVLDITDIQNDKATLACSDFNMRAMVREVLDRTTESKEKKKQSLSVEIDDAVPETVYGDKSRLSQALGNLLSNAVKFTGELGEIHLRVSVPDRKEETVTLQFEVIDNGVGISKEQQEKIFLLFEQADESASRQFEGMGSGLFIAKYIIEMMGGRLWVESELGHGSKFAFTVEYERITPL